MKKFLLSTIVLTSFRFSSTDCFIYSDLSTKYEKLALKHLETENYSNDLIKTNSYATLALLNFNKYNLCIEAQRIEDDFEYKKGETPVDFDKRLKEFENEEKERKLKEQNLRQKEHKKNINEEEINEMMKTPNPKPNEIIYEENVDYSKFKGVDILD